MPAQSRFLAESVGCSPHMMEVQLVGEVGPGLSTNPLPQHHRTLCWSGLLSTEQLIQMFCKWMAISLPSCITWQFCFLWFHGHRDTHPTRWQQSWSLILALSQFPGTCCMWWALWDHWGSDLHLPLLQSPGSVLMHIRKHQSQFCSWFYAQMRKDSCPATSEGPVQPYVSVHGVPEGCPPVP